ncbi:MAG: hypothetical protein HN406_03535 [Lentisphaerae bacterium]|nr:hypothetical protein [Lentisphaerota bacterium]
MTTPIITGSFFDLQHVNVWDAVHWTDRCRFWKEANWRALVRQNLAGLERAREVVDDVGVTLWTNCEVFSFRWGPDGDRCCRYRHALQHSYHSGAHRRVPG